ncbi:beta strand repeat-containing protein [Massilia pseudoviolaceinigra]|uniref:beta strand repeat-containing protein n=1 Tax=Massilia pseudoviolaceinigra TaxID=3057165 RepID=UPI00279670C8|nr:calcium-binding protein [Massilia sp. CCM 9206]MDQ1920016.1 calcium-binding protein [Massilia sp. CCM 9206]
MSLTTTTASFTTITGTAGNDTLTGGDADEILQGQAGADKLDGLAGNDTVDGGAGNDYIDSGLGSDVYLFGRGDGRDIIYGTGVRPPGDINTLRFREGVLPSDLAFDMAGASLIIKISNSTDQIQVDGFLYGDNTGNTSNPLQQIVFADGTTWNLAAIEARLYAGTDAADTRTGTYLGDLIMGQGGADRLDGKAGNDSIDGGADADTLVGGLGNDLLIGGDGSDSLSGGDGNDTLDGGAGYDELIDGLGNDTYLFGRGDGLDRIASSRDAAGKLNTLQLKAGVLPADIILRTDSAGSLFVQIRDSADQVVVASFLSGDSSDNTSNPLQQITFADGTTWNRAAIEAVLYAGTDTDDFLAGTLAAESIRGAAGNDHLNGKAGNDSLDGGAGDDRMFGGSGDDLLLGGTGNDALEGGDGNDTLDGGAGNDQLDGQVGTDVILFGKGDGKDTVKSVYPLTSGQTDILQFKSGVLPGDLALSSDFNGELVMKINGSDDQLTIGGFRRDDSANLRNPVQEFKFADGTSWTPAAAEAVLFAGTDGADMIHGSFEGERITGLAGDDQLNGMAGDDSLDGGDGADRLFGGLGNDLLTGGAGNDDLYSDDGNDTLDGGAGNDNLVGGLGNDTYLFGRGDGHDNISSSNDPAAKLNTLQLKAGVLPADITVYMDSSSTLHIRIKDSGDWIAVGSYLAGDTSDNQSNPLQQITFADGTTWNRAAIEALLYAGTDSDDFLPGTVAADTIDGMAGNDNIDGKGGNDTVDGGAGDDVIYGGSGDDLLLGGAGIDRLNGQEGNDTLDGGLGNDDLSGGGGNDVFLFGQGDGQDTVGRGFSMTSGETDILQFKAGVLPGDLTLSSGNNGDLIVKLKGSDDQLILASFMRDDSSANPANPVQQFRFADGSGWTLDAAEAVLFAGTDGADAINGTFKGERITGQAGADSLDGKAGNDTLDGGAGNDVINGGIGSDTYLFGRGDGNDEINAVTDSTAGKTDTLQFKPGIVESDLILTRSGDKLTIGIKGTSDTVLVNSFLSGSSAGSAANPLNQIRFDNGSTWDAAAIMGKLLLVATEGNDTLDGFDSADAIAGLGGSDRIDGKAGNDTLDGGLGNDWLEGGLGNDTFLFGKGDGQDTILNGGTGPASDSEFDILQMKEGVLPGEVTLSTSGANLLVKINGGTDQVQVNYFLFRENTGHAFTQLKQIRFADGTAWSLADIETKLLVATAGADELNGTLGADSIAGLAGSDKIDGRAGDDTIDGGTGSDTILGGLGNDTYLFGKGDGIDVITAIDNEPSARINTLQFKAGVLASDVTLSSTGSSLVVKVAGGDQITVQNFLYLDDSANVRNPLQQIVFADGKSWNLAAIEARLFSGTNGSDQMNGSVRDNTLLGFGGADTLNGKAGNDTLDGGTGNDNINGGTGSDTYLFGRGDGMDTIVGAGDSTPGKVDTLQFKAGILPGDVHLSRVGTSLVVKHGSGTDQVTVMAFLYQDDPGNIGNPLQQIRFNDGTTWNVASILASLHTGTSASDSIAGTVLADTISGFAGADQLDGKGGNDTLDGGSGNDSITGGTGSDTYLFGRGDGHDYLVSTTDSAAGKVDTLQFKAAIAGGDLHLAAVGSTLIIKIDGTVDQITAYNVLPQGGVANVASPLQQIRFADGVMWDMARIQAELLADATPVPAIAAPMGMNAPEGEVVLVAQASLQAW